MKNETSTSIGLAVVLAFAIVFGLILTRQSSQYDVTPSSKSGAADTLADSTDSPVRGATFAEPPARDRDEPRAAQPQPAQTTDPAPQVVAEASDPPAPVGTVPSPTAAKPPDRRHVDTDRPASRPARPEPARPARGAPTAPPSIQIPRSAPPAKAPAEPKPPAPQEPQDETDRLARASAEASGIHMASSTEQEPGGRTYVVRPNDTLRKVCKAVYGTSSSQAVRAVFEANSDRLKSMNSVKVGQRLRLPDLSGGAPAARPKPTVTKTATKAKPPPSRGKTSPLLVKRQAGRSLEARPRLARVSAPATTCRWHRVKRNESLRDIARRELGNSGRWREIWELNKDKIRSPDRLAAGMRLKLPSSGPQSMVAMMEPLEQERI
jgi:nucleoid-associated protein YgaU